MHGRGWRKERWLETSDTSGRPVRITTGLTVDARGEDVVGLAITALGPVSVVGPTAVLTLDSGSDVVGDLLRASLADLFKQQGGA
ncbi:hypothetical protein ACFPN7_15950 [Amycolatopsis halotolerans]